MKKVFLFILLFCVSFLSKSQTVRTSPAGFVYQSFGTPTTWTEMKGILYSRVGYAPALYTDTTAANATDLDQVGLCFISTSSDGKWWRRNWALTKWEEVTVGGVQRQVYDTSLVQYKSDTILFRKFNTAQTTLQNNWANYSGYSTYVTETPVAEGLDIVSTRTSYNYNSSVPLDTSWESAYNDVTIYMEFRVVSLGSSFPFIGTVMDGATNLYANNGNFYINLLTGGVTFATSSFGNFDVGVLSNIPNANDVIRLIHRRRFDVDMLMVVNITDETSQTFSHSYGGAQAGCATTNIYPGWFFADGNIVLRSYSFYGTGYNPDLLIVGASIQQNQMDVPSYDSSYAGRLAQLGNRIVGLSAQCGNNLQDFQSNLKEIKALKPKAVLLGDVGYNEIYVSAEAATVWQPKYRAFVDSLVSFGTRVVIMRQTPNPSNAIPDTLNAFIDSVYSNHPKVQILDIYTLVDFYNPDSTNNAEASYFRDGIHWNGKPSKSVADQVRDQLERMNRYSLAGATDYNFERVDTSLIVYKNTGIGKGEFRNYKLGPELYLAGGNIRVASGSPVSPKYINILLSGQSNAWGASGPTGLDTAANSRVLIWNHAQTTPGWVTARINQRPFRTSTYNSVDGGSANPSLAGSNNHTFYYAKKLAEENPNDTVRIVMAIGDGAAINEWFSYFTWTKGKYLDSITTRAIASGVTKFDKFIWDQGESNTYQNTGIYFRAFDSIKAVLRGYSWFPRNTPISVVGMPRLYMGASPTAIGIDTLLQWMDRGDDQFVGYASTDSLALSNAFNHFDSTGYRTLGQQRLPTVFSTIPHRYSELYNGYLDTLYNISYNNISGSITNSGGVWSLPANSYGVDTTNIITGNGVYEITNQLSSGIFFAFVDTVATPITYQTAGTYNGVGGWFLNGGGIYAYNGNTSSASYAASVDTSNVTAVRIIRIQDTLKVQARFKDIYFTVHSMATRTSQPLYMKIAAYTGSSTVVYPKSTVQPTTASSGGGANTSLSNLSAVAINTSLLPGTDDGAAMGSTTKRWSDLFLAEGGVINWDNGDMTLTQSGNTLTVAGGVISNPGAGTSSETFGSGATAAGQNGTAVGNGATASATNSGAYGQNAQATAAQALAFGPSATASAAQATALGVLATASGINATAVGEGSTASANLTISLGHLPTASHQNAFVVGESAASTATNQIVFGGSAVPYTDMFLGGGVTLASPVSFSINSNGGSGTNVAGGALVIAGGKGTGNAAGGSINFQTSTAGSSGTTLQTLSTKLSISPNSAAFSTRVLNTQGADVASANNLSLGTDGNTFEITGTTQINLIANTNWQNGSEITLLLPSGITVKHGQATSGSNITISLSGAADLVTAAETSLTLVLSEVGGTQKWRQKGAAISY